MGLSSKPLLLVLCAFLAGSRAQYVAESILCDDLEAICSKADIPMTNDTLCGEKHDYLNPEICNCGNECISFLEEGDNCIKTSPAFFPPELCGYGLECMRSDDDGNSYCARNTDKKCIGEAVEYEAAQAEGTVGPGQHKSNCDEFGEYAGRQCSPGGTCYCVNSLGERLFGEALTTEQESMDCECARYWEEMESKGQNSGLRCLPNGNFDELQCLGSICYCLDMVKKNITFGPFPANIFNLAECYDETLHGTTYERSCEVDQEEWDRNNNEIANVTVIQETARPICNPDGYYAAVQHRGSYAYCSDLHGRQIEDFQQEIYLAANQNCNCARRRQIMEENGLSASKPKCCPNGNYYAWQRRGLLAFCVDSNGNQYGPEVAVTDITQLDCLSNVDPCDLSS